MDRKILQPKVQHFIHNFTGHVKDLVFSKSPFEGIMTKTLVQQIEGRQKSLKKLPTFYTATGVYFPPKLNIGQASSEITANYKASLVAGRTLADITGGLGVDSLAFSKKFETVHYFELNTELAEIAAHNFKVFGAGNITAKNEDGTAAVTTKKYDVIYADPSRRDAQKEKTFTLHRSQPDIPANLGAILKNSKTFLLKTAPMLDITEGLRALKHVVEVHCVAVNNEMKELLWVIKNG
ncbi:MAG: class I SAM-dependent methyltransferase, partial [Marinirhabdus sp.]